MAADPQQSSAEPHHRKGQPPPQNTSRQRRQLLNAARGNRRIAAGEVVLAVGFRKSPLCTVRGEDKGSDKGKKKDNVERDECAKKSLSIIVFLKPAEGERYPGERGRGRGRGDRGGYHCGYSPRGPVAVPSIEDQVQFPTLGGK